MSTLRGAAHAIMAQRDGGGLPTEAHWNALRAALAALPAEAAPSPSPSSAPRDPDSDAREAALWAQRLEAIDHLQHAVSMVRWDDEGSVLINEDWVSWESVGRVALDYARHALRALNTPMPAPASPQGEPTHYAPALAVGACAEGETSGPFTGHPSLVTCHACQNYVWMEIGRYRASPQGERERALEEYERFTRLAADHPCLHEDHDGNTCRSLYPEDEDTWCLTCIAKQIAASSPHYAEKGD